MVKIKVNLVINFKISIYHFEKKNIKGENIMFKFILYFIELSIKIHNY